MIVDQGIFKGKRELYFCLNDNEDSDDDDDDDDDDEEEEEQGFQSMAVLPTDLKKKRFG